MGCERQDYNLQIRYNSYMSLANKKIFLGVLIVISLVIGLVLGAEFVLENNVEQVWVTDVTANSYKVITLVKDDGLAVNAGTKFADKLYISEHNDVINQVDEVSPGLISFVTFRSDLIRHVSLAPLADLYSPSPMYGTVKPYNSEVLIFSHEDKSIVVKVAEDGSYTIDPASLDNAIPTEIQFTIIDQGKVITQERFSKDISRPLQKIVISKSSQFALDSSLTKSVSADTTGFSTTVQSKICTITTGKNIDEAKIAKIGDSTSVPEPYLDPRALTSVTTTIDAALGGATAKLTRHEVLENGLDDKIRSSIETNMLNAPVKPYAAFIMFGLNDCGKDRLLPDFKKDLVDLGKELEAAGIVPVISTLTPTTKGPNRCDNLNDPSLHDVDFYRAAVEVAIENNWPLRVNYYDAIGLSKNGQKLNYREHMAYPMNSKNDDLILASEISSDGVHLYPSAEAHAGVNKGSDETLTAIKDVIAGCNSAAVAPTAPTNAPTATPTVTNNSNQDVNVDLQEPDAVQETDTPENERPATDAGSQATTAEATLLQSFSPGWNIISFDTTAIANKDSKALMTRYQELGYKFRHMVRFDGSKFNFNTYREGKFYGDPFVLDAKNAYFIFSEDEYASKDNSINSTSSGSFNLADLKNGWNLVSSNSLLPTYPSASKLIQSVPSVKTIAAYSSGNYSLLVNENGQEFGNDIPFKKSTGYFVKVGK
jgi:hypothetical protein